MVAGRCFQDAVAGKNHEASSLSSAELDIPMPCRLQLLCQVHLILIGQCGCLYSSKISWKRIPENAYSVMQRG